MCLHLAPAIYSRYGRLSAKATAQTRRSPRGWKCHCLSIHAARRRPSGRLAAFLGSAKIEHLIGLDRCFEILSWPSNGLDPLRRSMQMQVMRVLLPIGIKAVLDGSVDRELIRERNRAAMLEELARDLSVGNKA